MSKDIAEDGRSFGNRELTDPEQVFKFNAWDNFTWDEDHEIQAKASVDKNSKTKVNTEQAEILEQQAGSYWEEFYDKHQNKFFKNRMWLFKEFPELLTPTAEPYTLPPSTSQFPGSNAKYRILEVGCGVGNTVFPLLQEVKDTNADVFIYACDFAQNAVEIVKSNKEYRCDFCHAFVCDVSDHPIMNTPFPEQSLDVVICIFVLSALHPSKMQRTINELVRFLRPGGLLLFRDYGKYDLAQLRFKEGQCIDDNFYMRQDKTRVYFFTEDELNEMFEKAGLKKEVNYSDRRLIVNRQKKITMSRVWIQCRYKKIQ